MQPDTVWTLLGVVAWTLLFTVHVLPRLAGERARQRIEAWIQSDEGRDLLIQLFTALLTSDKSVGLVKGFASTLARSLWGHKLGEDGREAQLGGRIEGAAVAGALGDQLGTLTSILRVADPELADQVAADPRLAIWAVKGLQKLGIGADTGTNSYQGSGGGGRRGV